MKIKNNPKHTKANTAPPLKHISRIMIAGTHSGVGKTTITLGIMAMLRKKGYEVQPFKSGPDYIDTGHHSEVTGKTSRNIDTWLMDEDACMELFYMGASQSQISVIEGVMGLYDGSLSDTLKGSSAYLAKILNTPIILVMDVKGMAQSAGAVALGFKIYNKSINIKGIVLNRVGSERHFNAIKRTIEEATEIPVIGYLPRDSKFAIAERHLGLVPSVEQKDSGLFYSELANQLEKTLNVEQVIEVANQASDFPAFNKTIFDINNSGIKETNFQGVTNLYPLMKKSIVRIAVAMDKAFHFYYMENLELLSALGAELVYFSPLNDKELPARIDGVYIGGGFPELFGPELDANESMRLDINKAAENGTVIYGECGGMMYLLDKLINCDGESFSMCGIFGVSSQMQKKRQGLGYIIVNAQKDNIMCKKGDVFKAHEFHWSSLTETKNIKDLSFAYDINKEDNDSFKFDGIFKKNVLGSYAHIHFATNPMLAVNFINTIRFVNLQINKF